VCLDVFLELRVWVRSISLKRLCSTLLVLLLLLLVVLLLLLAGAAAAAASGSQNDTICCTQILFSQEPCVCSVVQ